MTIFEFENYKTYVLERIQAMPNRGRGEFKRMASHLRVHSTLISHVFSGDADLTFEQAADLLEYLGLNEFESEYFLTLVQKSRAGSAPLRQIIERKLTQLRDQATQLVKRVQPAKVLGEKEKAMFYSEWFFSGVRLASAIPGCQDIDHIAQKLGLKKTEVARVVEFLLESGLCEQIEGQLTPAVHSTYVSGDSPLAGRHHKNWRLKAMERYSRLHSSELAFTKPVTVSQADALKIRKSILHFVQETDRVMSESPPEVLYCLNLDWFEVV